MAVAIGDGAQRMDRRAPDRHVSVTTGCHVGYRVSHCRLTDRSDVQHSHMRTHDAYNGCHGTLYIESLQITIEFYTYHLA